MNLEDIFNTPTGKEDPFEPILIPHLKKAMEDANRKTVKDEFLRSSAIGGCPRYALYKLKGYEEELEARDVMTLETGTQVHEIVQKYLKDTGLLVSLEEKVSGIDGLFGSYDGLVKIGTKKYLLEIKTMNTEAYERMLLYRKIYPKYKKQATSYMMALGVDETIFIFINRNYCFSSEFEKTYREMEYDPVFLEVRYKLESKIAEELKQTVKDLYRHHQNGTMPERKTVSQCSYCSLVDRCKADWKDEKKAAKDKTK